MDIIKGIIALLIFVLPFVAILLPVFMVVRGVKKQKNKLVVIFSIVLAIELFALILFFVLFPTRFPYCDMWIKGKTADEIVAEYGEPDIWTSTKFGYDVGQSHAIFNQPANVNDYYYIEFDENGCANDVYIALQPGG